MKILSKFIIYIFIVLITIISYSCILSVEKYTYWMPTKKENCYDSVLKIESIEINSGHIFIPVIPLFSYECNGNMKIIRWYFYIQSDSSNIDSINIDSVSIQIKKSIADKYTPINANYGKIYQEKTTYYSTKKLQWLCKGRYKLPYKFKSTDTLYIQLSIYYKQPNNPNIIIKECDFILPPQKYIYYWWLPGINI